MSSEIEKNDHMVSANGEVPWHQMGTVVAGAPTSTEALKLAKLDWQNLQEPVFDADQQEINGFLLNRRSDDRSVLGIVAKGWTPLQNERLLEIAESLGQVDGQDFRPVIETAGSLRGGKIVWALIQTGARTFHDSLHRQYLLLSNGHDGRRGIRGTVTDVRVVCANTLSAAESGTASLFLTHTVNLEDRLARAMEVLGWTNDSTRATFAIYEALRVTACPADKARAFFTDILPKDEDLNVDAAVVDGMVELFRHGAGNEGENYFDALNAVTDWVDHKREFRVAGPTETRFLHNSLGGEGDRLKTKALRRAAELVTV